MKIGILGAGSMGTGIAQVAATAGHEVLLYDNKQEAVDKALNKLVIIYTSLVEKGKCDKEEADRILGRISGISALDEFEDCGLIVEAIVENLAIKQTVFAELEKIVDVDCILATNTSSLSVTSIASACNHPERVMGLHFFNPPSLMPLVEVIPAIQTNKDLLNMANELMKTWGKVTIVARDTPGFVVNRVARPYYGEALRIYEEGIASFATIDWALTELGGFKMGPFTLMDFIGNDVNYAVTESVWTAFYFDPRYRPSFTQKRLNEAGWLGKKSGRGYYDYSEGAVIEAPVKELSLGNYILERILVMLINEAADAVYLNIASAQDVDLAMVKGVNYPLGLLAWADKAGIPWCVNKMDSLYETYREDRYRCSPLLRQMASQNKFFYTEQSASAI